MDLGEKLVNDISRRIWGYLSGDYEECHFLGGDCVQSGSSPMFRSSILPLSSGSKLMFLLPASPESLQP